MPYGALKRKIKGSITVPGDKSISHRAVMLGGIAKGESLVRGFLKSADCLSTINCLSSLGIETEEINGDVAIRGKGLYGLRKYEKMLDAGNSGTTIRLLSGILAGQEFKSIITGDESLQRRPMSRIAIPLRQMGASVEGVNGGEHAPLYIQGGRLKGIDYILPIPSAQVKSAVLLAGLYAEDVTRVIETVPSRDHTEIMLEQLGARINKKNGVTEISNSELYGKEIYVPGDMSGAAFFITAAAVSPGSELVVRGVGVNPTRIGILTALSEMGADIQLDNIHVSGGEAVADVIVRGRQLRGITVNETSIPAMIDEIPILAVAAAFAEGTTLIRGAAELKVKESNRIKAMVSQLERLGVKIRELEDGMEIEGPNTISGGEVESFGDHRIAMALAVCGLFADSAVNIKGKESVSISFPGFFEVLSEVIA